MSAVERLDALSPGLSAAKLRSSPDLARKLLESLSHQDEPGKSTGATLVEQGSLPVLAHDAPEPNELLARQTPSGAYRRALPDPVQCAGWRFCEGAGQYRCLTSMSPLGGGNASSLAAHVSAQTPYYDQEAELPGLTPLAVWDERRAQGRWAIVLGENPQFVSAFFSQQVPSGRHLPADRKWIFVGNGRSGPMDIEFETTEDWQGNGDPRITVCRPRDTIYANLYDEDAVQFRLDDRKAKVVEVVRHLGLPTGTCVVLKLDVGVGKHTLTIKALQVEGPVVAVSHVIVPL